VKVIDSYQNTVLIYNPRAGKFGQHGRALLTKAVEILTADGHNVTVIPTTGPKSAGTIAHEAIGRGADLILVAGGDGTINETAEGMIGSRVPLGILPAGTANVLAMEMKLGARIERVAARLKECQAYRISVGRVVANGANARHFLLMAGVGLDAHIVYNVDGSLKRKLGKLAYWVAGWSLLGKKLVEFDIEIDGQKRRCSFALLSKVRNYGGDLEIARGVTLFDDTFEAVVFEGQTTVPYVKYFAGVALNRLQKMSGVQVLRVSRARMSAPEKKGVYVQIDGEVAGRLPAEFSIVPDALTLLVPPEYAARAPEARPVAAANARDWLES
jgi:YegS/Rv2252/BmrU family lipid kinase